MSGGRDKDTGSGRDGLPERQPDAPLDDRTGNGTVNNRPDNGHGAAAPEPSAQRDPRPGDGAATSAFGPGTGLGAASGSGAGPDTRSGFGTGAGRDSGPGGPESGSDSGPDFAADLGLLLQHAVDGLQPSDGALDRLRTAVPARRARKRQMLVGAVAAVVLTGTAVPALLHVAGSDGSTSTNTANAGHDRPTGGGGDESSGTSGGPDGALTPRPDDGKGQEPGPGDRPGGPSADTSYSEDATGDPGATDGTGETPVKSSPACEPSQLDVTSAAADAPDADGRVYGAFRVANVSTSECAVKGAGKITFTVNGAADESRISVVEHTGGDAAPGLPAPAKENGPLLLKPAAAYEVRFAWVPEGSCPTGQPSPDPSTTEGTANTGGGSGNPAGPPPAGTDTQPNGPDPAPAEGSVSVTHTADPGAPTAETTIPNACAGTIYRTGALGD
ncbi:hypothetical protein ACWDR0_03180 [Streptomyces sp. NPDC003691]